jgi:hypothetical protein
MAKQIINNSETGLAVRTKLNSNFAELYDTKVGGSGLSSILVVTTAPANPASDVLYIVVPPNSTTASAVQLGNINLFANTGGGNTGGEFNPATISGLQLWLDAADSATLFDSTSGGNLVTNDNASVARWADKSGNSRHALQSTANSRPVLKTGLKNGKNILRFDGANDFFDIYSMEIPQPYTIFAAFIFRNNGSYLFDKTNGTNRVAIGWNASGTSSDNGKVFYYASGSSVPQDSQNSASTGLILSTLFNGELSFMRKNGAQILSGNGGTTSIESLRFGTSFALSAPLNGDLYEVLVYNSILTQTQFQSVETYLNSKWAIY